MTISGRNPSIATEQRKPHPIKQERARTGADGVGEFDGFDAAVIGGGTAGLSACIFLQRAGLRVVCIEPEEFPHDRVGESLDWSSPGLLEELGIPRNELISRAIATHKRNIKIVGAGRPSWTAQPKEWLRHQPLAFETVTLHVNRIELDQRIFEIARRLGVTFIWERVARVETEGQRVTACETNEGKRITAPWFIDGSGQARLFARAFDIPKVEYGKPKVVVWARFKTRIHNEGTTFYIDPDPGEYLSWIWDIPITPIVSSIGFVIPADRLKELRGLGSQVKDIFCAELAKHPRLERLTSEQPDFTVFTCSYRTYVHQVVSGDNWFMVGESASFPDPLTSNGVTSAIRHAKEASSLILESPGQSSLSRRRRWAYEKNARGMGHIFNLSIERAIYSREVRAGLGVYLAQKVYTAFSYTINALYTKFDPQTRLKSTLFGLLLNGVWTWIEWWALLGSARLKLRPHRSTHPPVASTFEGK